MPRVSQDRVMQGGGFYNRHSALQAGVVSHGLSTLSKAAEALAGWPADRLFRLADYGCSEGRNSLEPVAAVLKAVRERSSAPIEVFHVDRPENDFTSLFRLLRHDPASYLRSAEDVHAYGVGHSFHDVLFPEGSLSLGWTANAVHWLSRAPCPLGTHIWQPLAEGEARAAWARQADLDWRRFLDVRARELHDDGRLVVVTLAADERGYTGAERLYDVVHDILKGLADEGLIQRAELEAMSLPTYYRTREELEGALPASPFEADEVREEISRDPAYEAYLGDRDAAAFASACAGYLAAAALPSLLSPLESDPERRDRVLDMIGSRFAERVAESPDDFRMDRAVVVSSLRRKPRPRQDGHRPLRPLC